MKRRKFYFHDKVVVDGCVFFVKTILKQRTSFKYDPTVVGSELSIYEIDLIEGAPVMSFNVYVHNICNIVEKKYGALVVNRPKKLRRSV